MSEQVELVEAMNQAGRSEDIPFFTGGARLAPGRSVPEPFEMTYSDGSRATCFAGVVEGSMSYPPTSAHHPFERSR